MPTRRALLVAFALATALPAAPPALADDTVVVFAAASLRNALDDVVAGYHAATGKAVTVSYAGSSTLARQIEQGAPADIFFSADRDWMTYLSDRKLIATDTERTLLGNEIVLIAPRDSGAGNVAIGNGLDLAPLLGADGRLAMANVEAVPAGKYGKAALMNLGGWDKVAGRIVEADNVRAALAFVASGEAPLGIVYATDADGRAGGQGHRHLPSRQPSADRLPGGAHRDLDQPGRARLPRLSRLRRGEAGLREAGLHGAGAGVVAAEAATLPPCSNR